MPSSAAESNEALQLLPLARSAWQDYRRSWPALVGFELLFKLLQVLVFAPALASLLAFVLARSGRVAVSNWDILDFFATPLGWVYVVILVTAAVAMYLLEQAAIMAIVAGTGPDRRLALRRVIALVTRAVTRLTKLGATQAAWLALAFTPFVLLAFLTYSLLLTGHDLYFYLSTRPAAFWVAAILGGLLALAALAVGTVLFVRWSFAVPILLFESLSPREALRASRERVRGAAWRVGTILLGWQAIVLAVGAGLLSLFRFTAELLLDRASEAPIALMLTLLVAQTALVAMGTVAGVIGQSVLTWQLYRVRSASLGVPCETLPGVVLPLNETPPVWCRYIVYLPMLLTIAGLPAIWLELERFREARPPVKVTAHRGHARAAPENTLSAIRRAIESGADYAEIDVQRTADDQVVLLHDRDLKRVAGDSRRLTDLNFEQVRELDVGRWFSPEFAGERVPTLAEVIDTARGKIKLNIELKLFGPDEGLARTVAELLRDKGVESDCLVTSFDATTLAEVKRIAPGARTGLIVAQAMGDVSRVEVDVLNVRADHLTDALLQEAHRRGREVHVWTVNDPREMARQIKRGVDNILTSDPDLLIQVRDDWERLTGPERLLLSSRLLLGLHP